LALCAGAFFTRVVTNSALVCGGDYLDNNELQEEKTRNIRSSPCQWLQPLSERNFDTIRNTLHTQY